MATGHRPLPPPGAGVGVGHPHGDGTHPRLRVSRLQLPAGTFEGHDQRRAGGGDAAQHRVDVEELLPQRRRTAFLLDGVEAAEGELALHLDQLGAEGLRLVVQLGVGVQQVAPGQVVEDGDPGVPLQGLVHVPVEERAAQLVDHGVEPGLRPPSLEGPVVVHPVAAHEVDVGQEALVDEHLDVDVAGQARQEVDGVVGDAGLLRGQGRPHRQPPPASARAPSPGGGPRAGRGCGRSRPGSHGPVPHR